MKRTADTPNPYEPAQYRRTESPPLPRNGVTANPGTTTPPPATGLTTDQHHALQALVRAAPQLQGAAELILNVANGHAVNRQDPHLPRQEAAKMLMHLGWDLQLRCLAEALPTPYRLSASRAHDVQVLERIGASWPTAANVILALTPPLQINDVEKLQAFLGRPEQLHIIVVIDKVLDTNVDDPSGIHAWRKAMNGRPLDSLEISVQANDSTTIQALHGVKTSEIVVNTTLPPAQQVDALFDAVLRLVEVSDAKALDIGHPGIDPNLATHLLCCKRHWERVVCGFDSNVLIEMRKRQVTIDALTWDPMKFRRRCAADLADLLDSLRVQTLTVMGAIELKPLCDVYLNTSPPLCTTRFVGFFIVPDDHDVMKDAIKALIKDKTVQLQHQDMPLQIPGFSPINAETAMWLDARASTMLATYHLSAHLPSQALAQEEAINAISNLLSAEYRVDHVIDYLKAPGNPLVKALRSPTPGIPLDSTMLKDKLSCIRHSVPDHLLMAAIEVAWRDHLKPDTQNPDPDDDVEEGMCKAILELGLRAPRQRAVPWANWCRDLKTHWMTTKTLDASRKRSMETTTETKIDAPAAPALTELVNPPGAYAMSQLMLRLKAVPGMPDTPLKEWFTTGNLGHYSQYYYASMVATLNQALVHEGQWQLLFHFALPGLPCSFHVKTSAFANQLATCPDWPKGVPCNLKLANDLSENALQAVIKFAQKVPRGQLKLEMPMARHDDAIWSAWKSLIVAAPGLGLAISQDLQAPLDVEGLVNLLASIQGLKEPLPHIAHISLDGFQKDDANLVSTLVQTMVAARTGSVEMRRCNSELVNAVLPCNAWQAVTVDLSQALAELFMSSTVSTRALTLIGPDDAGNEHESMLVYQLVTHCATLKQLELQNRYLDVLVFAKMLHAKPSIEGFVGALSSLERRARRLDHERQALAILRSNTSLRTYRERVVHRHGIEPLPETNKAVVQIVRRNNWLNPDTFARGAAKGFGIALGQSPERNVNTFLAQPFEAFLGPVLDPRTAKALATTSKAAYLESKAAWVEQEEALIECLAPETAYTAVAQQLTSWISKEVLAGELPLARSPSMPLMIDKVRAMERGRMPVMAISQAIGTHLQPYLQQEELPNEPPDAVMPYLEALAYIGVIPARQWLHHVLGLSSDIAPPAEGSDSDSDSDSDD